MYVAPGSPWENGYVESFHSRFRNDCLNREWFINELDAKVAIGDWREHYNERRPHSGIDYQSPRRNIVWQVLCLQSGYALLTSEHLPNTS